MPSSQDSNVLATKRDKYIESLGDAFADKYGDWLQKQTPEKQNRIKRKTGSISHGLATIAPLTCLGPKRCPFFASCPIPQDTNKPGPDSEYPIDMPCVLEIEYVSQQVVSYIDELKVDPTNAVEMSLVNELALLDLLRNRAVMILSHGDRRGHGRDLLTVDETIVGFDKYSHEPMTNTTTREHPAIGIMEKHERRRQKILEKFAATRDSHFRVYGGNLEGNSKLLQDIAAFRSFIQEVSKSGVYISSDQDEPVQLDVKRPLVLEDFDEAIK